MKTFNIHEAKTHLSRLVEDAANGEPFIIAKAGKPLVKVSALTAPDDRTPSRIGFMAGEFDVSDDFDELGKEAIEATFYGQIFLLDTHRYGPPQVEPAPAKSGRPHSGRNKPGDIQRRQHMGSRD